MKGLDQVDLTIGDGDFVAVIGLSGAGKSTFLRAINRLHDITEGDIRINGVSVTGAGKKQLRVIRRHIGMISQSGQIVLGGLDSPNMGFSHVISSGNSCNVKVEDYLDFLVEDEDTKVVAAYIEGVSKPEKLVETFRKAAIKKKPVVVLKTGRSGKAQELAKSHTGSFPGQIKS